MNWPREKGDPDYAAFTSDPTSPERLNEGPIDNGHLVIGIIRQSA